MSVRKAHNSGRNHLRNVVDYYQQIGHEKAQSVIDSITSSYAAEGQAGANPMLQTPGVGTGGFGMPPPFGFPGRPGGMPAPPFGLPGGPMPPNLPPNARGPMPPFPPPGNLPFPPPFPMPSASPQTGGMPPFPPPPGQNGMPPFPPSGGMPNFPFPPPQMSPMGMPGGFAPPGQGR